MKNNITFLADTLGLPTSWQIKEAHLLNNSSILEIKVKANMESNFLCPCCGAKASVQSESEEIWHNPDFMHTTTLLNAQIPYISCPLGCGLQRITPPWQHANSRFTLKK